MNTHALATEWITVTPKDNCETNRVVKIMKSAVVILWKLHKSVRPLKPGAGARMTLVKGEPYLGQVEIARYHRCHSCPAVA